MQTSISELENDEASKTARAEEKKMDAIGWGLFFIWVGIAFVANFGWGVGLLGVGLIILGVQIARKCFGLAVERFSLVIGSVFCVWGAWDLLRTQVGEVPMGSNLVPILFIAIGIFLVASPFLGKPR